jgi:hypothetical protein
LPLLPHHAFTAHIEEEGDTGESCAQDCTA